MIYLCRAYEDRAQQGEYICLDVCNQKFQRIHEDVEKNRDESHRTSQGRARAESDENQDGQDKHCHMPAEHVCKKPYHQGDRLCKNTYQLDQRHERNRSLEPGRNVRPEDFLPILPGSEHVHGYEGAKSQEHGDGHICSDAHSAREYREKAHQVAGENKEESRQKVWRKLSVILTDARFYDSVFNHIHKHLHKAHVFRRNGIAVSAVPLIPSCSRKEKQKKYGPVYQQSQTHLGKAQVKRPYKTAVRHLFHQFVGVRPVLRGGIEALVTSTVLVQSSGREDMPARCRAVENNRKINHDILLPDLCNVPGVGV